MSDACTEQDFLNDVREHKMTVLLNHGLYRHLRFKRPNTGMYWFEVITTPGAVTIMGDVGAFVMRRLEDMFEFVRIDQGGSWAEAHPGRLFINPGYWAEKLVATEKTSGHEEFSEARFAANVADYFKSWVESSEPSEEVQAALWNEMKAEVIAKAEDGEYAAYAAAHDFRSTAVEGFRFRDFTEYNSRGYTHAFLWCCYALAWAVKAYDERAEKKAAQAEGAQA